MPHSVLSSASASALLVASLFAPACSSSSHPDDAPIISSDASDAPDAANSSACSSTAQCTTAGDECAPGGVATGGAFICAEPSVLTCAKDTDCSTAEICVIEPCTYADGGAYPYPGACFPACTDDFHCGAGECSGGHCTNPTCTSDSDCHTDFTCSPSSHTCVATPCTTDSQCTGFCVNGTCSTAAGQCTPVPL